MADRHLAPDTPELRVRWDAFEFSPAWKAKAGAAILGALDVVFGECDR